MGDSAPVTIITARPLKLPGIIFSYQSHRTDIGRRQTIEHLLCCRQRSSRLVAWKSKAKLPFSMALSDAIAATGLLIAVLCAAEHDEGVYRLHSLT
jgi:hypothetical protein